MIDESIASINDHLSRLKAWTLEEKLNNRWTHEQWEALRDAEDILIVIGGHMDHLVSRFDDLRDETPCCETLQQIADKFNAAFPTYCPLIRDICKGKHCVSFEPSVVAGDHATMPKCRNQMVMGRG